MKSLFLPKYEQKITQGRNSDNFLFLFWEKRFICKFILKLTDLYSQLLYALAYLTVFNPDYSLHTDSLNRGGTIRKRDNQLYIGQFNFLSKLLRLFQ